MLCESEKIELRKSAEEFERNIFKGFWILISVLEKDYGFDLKKMKKDRE